MTVPDREGRLPHHLSGWELVCRVSLFCSPKIPSRGTVSKCYFLFSIGRFNNNVGTLFLAGIILHTHPLSLVRYLEDFSLVD